MFDCTVCIFFINRDTIQIHKKLYIYCTMHQNKKLFEKGSNICATDSSWYKDLNILCKSIRNKIINNKIF